MMIKTGLILLGTVAWLSSEPSSRGDGSELKRQLSEPEHLSHMLAEVALTYIVDKGDKAHWAW